MEQTQKQKILKRVFWGAVFFNFSAMAGLGLWVFLKPGIAQPGFAAQNPAPQVLGAISAPLRGPEQPILPSLFEETGQLQLDSVSAKSFLVYDAETGQDLLARDPDQRLGIASLTKLLTAYTAYQQLNMAGEIIVPSSTDSSISPSLKLRPGDRIKTLDIFNAMLIGSENDAAGVLASVVKTQTGQSAVALMNQAAQVLGMSNSHFGNPFGFDYGNNYSTANDLKKLVSQTQQLRAFTALESKTGYSFKGSFNEMYRARATNKLVGSRKNIYAIKTGYTETTLGSIALKTYIEGRPVVVIVLGSLNREADALRLIDEVTKNFRLAK